MKWTQTVFERALTAMDFRYEITNTDLRWGGILHALKEWEIVSRRVATQSLSGSPLNKAVFDARTSAEALRILDQAERRHRPRRIRRRGEREELIREVAAAYREEVAASNSRPRVALAKRFAGEAPKADQARAQTVVRRGDRPV